MKVYFRACLAEVLKLHRARITWILALVVLFSAAMLAFFTWIMLQPDLADSLGLLGQKAKLSFGVQAPDWTLYSTFMVQISGMGGMLLAAVVLIYLFGREYTQGTAKVVFTLPFSRLYVVAAKLTIALLWYLGLMAMLLVVAGLGGNLVGLGPLPSAINQALVERIPAILASGFGVSIFAAWVAVASGGFFAPLGYAIISLLLSTIFANTGWGAYIPWSIISLLSEAGPSGAALEAPSALIMMCWTLLSLTLLVLHQLRADNTQ